LSGSEELAVGLAGMLSMLTEPSGCRYQVTSDAWQQLARAEPR